MKKHIIPILLLAVYGAVLIKVMVFKDLPTIRIGQLMLNFAGTDTGHGPNFIPFATIAPYLLGHKGLIIAGINLVGNIALLVPVGFLIPFVYRSITWEKSLLLAVFTGLTIEVMQTVLRVGIFDIDDVILNALGVMIGYGVSTVLIQWMHSKKYKHIIIAAFATIAAATFFYVLVVYPISHQQITHRVNNTNGALGTEQEDAILPSQDLCGGTGGIGQVVSIGNNTFTIERKEGQNQIVNLADQAVIEVPAGTIPLSDLKAGNRVTLVGGPNPDGSFTADAVFVCSVPN